MDHLVLMEMLITVILVLVTLYPGTVSSKEMLCEVPKFPDNCFYELTHRRVNGTVTYDCEEGYWYTGTRIRVCQQDLTWSGVPGIVKEVQCPQLLHPPHGRIVVAGRKFKDRALVTCDEGYVFSHPQFNPRICQGNNTWTSTDGKCNKIECPHLLRIPHGEILYSGEGNKATATVTCDGGYRYSKPKAITRTCQDNSTWSSASGVCKEVQCPRFGNELSFGEIVYHGTGHKAKATVKCQVGYVYSNPEAITRTCQGDNTWSLQFDGECQKLKKFCPAVPTADNVIPLSSGAYYRSKVLYKCKDGYTPTGPETIRCEDNRQWSALSIKCVSKQTHMLSIVTLITLIVLLFVLAIVVCTCSRDMKCLQGKHCIFVNQSIQALLTPVAYDVKQIKNSISHLQSDINGNRGTGTCGSDRTTSRLNGNDLVPVPKSEDELEEKLDQTSPLNNNVEA